MSIDIKGIDHPTLLAELYNAARPLGMGKLQARKEPMTRDEAVKLLEVGKRFDYVHGRPLKICFDRDELTGERLYDRDQGEGLCAKIVERVRKSTMGASIIVNGESHHVMGRDFITYEQIVGLAGMNGTPSMTWKIRGTSEGGILSTGGDVAVRDCLVFNVVHTGNA